MTRNSGEPKHREARLRRDPVAGTPPTRLESLEQMFRFEPVIEIPTQTPEEAMRETWLRVGDDLRVAMGQAHPDHERVFRDRDRGPVPADRKMYPTARSAPGSVLEVRQEAPLGPPLSADDLCEYESTLPGVADRIVRLAEGHAADCWRSNRNRRLSTILLPAIAAGVASVMALSLIGGGVWLVANGHLLSGFGALAGPAACVAVALVRAAGVWSRANGRR